MHDAMAETLKETEDNKKLNKELNDFIVENEDQDSAYEREHRKTNYSIGELAERAVAIAEEQEVLNGLIDKLRT